MTPGALPREARDAAAAAKPLERPRLPEPDRPVVGQAQVADLAGTGARRAVVEAAGEHEPRAHPGPEREEDEVLAAAPRAPFPLGERPGVGVVLQQGGHAEPLGKRSHSIHPVPAGQVGRGKDEPARAVERAAAADADGLGRRAVLPDEVREGVAERGQRGGRGGGRWEGALAQHLHAVHLHAVAHGARERGGALRPADVEAGEDHGAPKKRVSSARQIAW